MVVGEEGNEVLVWVFLPYIFFMFDFSRVCFSCFEKVAAILAAIILRF